jgi:hypothetical protein
MVNDGQVSDPSDYIRSVGDGVTSGIREGIKRGTRRGSRRGIAAGVRDCLARGLVGSGGGLEALAGHIAVSDVDLSSVKGRLDEAGGAVVRQLRYRVRETDKVRGAIDGIKQRIVSELPRNPLSGVIGRKAQESLDGGIVEGGEVKRGDVSSQDAAADGDKVAGKVRKNVRSGVEEVASFLVYTIVREVTNRAVAEASRGMKDRAVRRLEGRLVKLERRLGTRSEKGLDKELVESIDQLEDIVTDESLNEASFHAKIDEAFGGSIKDYIASLSARGLSPAGKALAVSAVVVATAALIWAIIYIALPNGDGSSPVPNGPTPTGTRTAEPPVATATPRPTQAAELPDLVIVYIDADDVGSQTVPEYMISYRIENVGNAEAGPSVVHLVVAGKRHCEDKVGAMGLGKGYDGEFNCTVSESELTLLRVCADGFQQVAELDEDNNCAEYEYQ